MYQKLNSLPQSVLLVTIHCYVCITVQAMEKVSKIEQSAPVCVASDYPPYVCITVQAVEKVSKTGSDT